MTQDHAADSRSERIRAADPDTFDPSKPRIGRRESEPHSLEVGYIHDVLVSNFPEHHALLDLHHYFQLNGDEYDLVFDVSFFMHFSLPYTLSSYRAREFQDRKPTMAINILSRSTWRGDLSDILDTCKLLEIPIYLVFFPFDVASKVYQPPFARAYQRMDDGAYSEQELRTVCIDTSGEINEKQLLDFNHAVPFRVGIEELDGKHENMKKRYRLVFVKTDTAERLLSAKDQEKTRADQEKTRADKYLKTLRDHGIDP